jgi:hypothetical protein
VKQPPYEHDSQLAWENLVIVMLTQAMLGLVGPAIRGWRTRPVPSSA